MPQFITLAPQAKDITGQRFGRLVALGPVGRNKRNSILWLCRCDCGGTATTQSTYLNNGDTQSCGCIQKAMLELRNTTHGMTNHPLYGTWTAMLARCTNPNVKSYPDYGGRGIEVCVEWRSSFKAYHDYVIQLPGYGDSDLSLDRIDNNGNYEPDNVRWVSRKIQRRNSRHNIYLTYQGETKLLTEWAEQLGMNQHTLYARIHSGWTVKRAMETPIAADPGGHSSRIK